MNGPGTHFGGMMEKGWEAVSLGEEQTEGKRVGLASTSRKVAGIRG